MADGFSGKNIFFCERRIWKLGDAVSMMFGRAFDPPHLKKTNDCKNFVPILKKQRPRSDKHEPQLSCFLTV
ncbi:MAG: hypothetical protein WB041_11075, partial [Pseudolabrys sp.]